MDLGSGQCGSTWYLAREGLSPIAVDGSLSALKKGRSRLKSEKLPFQGACADLSQLPFAARSFDAVVDVVASAHNNYAAIRQIFMEVARILKPDGLLFSVLPTNQCNRKTFKGFVTTFLEEGEVALLLEPHFTDLKILRSTYYLDLDWKIDNWVVTANKRS